MILILITLILLVALWFWLRAILILLGFLKDPILHHFEKYGDEEHFFYLFPQFFGWFGVLCIMFEFWLKAVGLNMIPLSLLGIVSIILWFATFYYLESRTTFPTWMLRYPRWLYELSGRTSRLERRRIAYMWLRLPWRLRLVYNSNDRAFRQWADMVILATLM